MKREILNAITPCMYGHCGFVEITSSNEINETKVLWCRYCGKLEVYENIIENGVVIMSRRNVDLTPKIFQIVKEKISGEQL